MRPAPPPEFFGRACRTVHLAGVGGAGMTPLAIYLAQSGLAVSGGDDALTPPVRTHLERAGVALTAAGELPAAAELLVFSSAIPPRHPVRAQAEARSLPQVRRGEMLAETLRDKKIVAVAGSHGKTTTTGMIITALRRAGFPCGWLLGGLFADAAVPPAQRASSDWVVAEIDESDGTIGHFSPEITVAVNLDWDHPDHYHRLADLEAEFAALFARTHTAVLINDTCVLSVRLAGEVGRGLRARAAPAPEWFTFGRSGDFTLVRAEESGERQRLALGGRFPAIDALVRARGDFNALNALAALAACQLLGAAVEPELLADYPGVRRRQSVLHEAGGLTVLEDYAHHPAEIRALLASLRRRDALRLVVVFQPHRYSRTAQFKAEFAAALGLADELYLLDVYPMGEAPVAGGTTADIYAELKQSGATTRVTYLPGRGEDLLRVLAARGRRGDLVAFVGAGDIDQRARDFVGLLRAQEARGAIWAEFCAAVRPQLSPATKLREHEPLAARTTMRVGGEARVYAEPANEDDLRRLLAAAAARGLAVRLLGRGSNLIVPDEGVDALVVALAHAHWRRFEPEADGGVWAGAGLRLKNLCGLAGQAGLRGFEFLEGIPGTVGGALRMNAGAMGGWMFDVVEDVRLMTFAGEVRALPKAAMHVAYRHCGELHDAIALGARLRPAAVAPSGEIRRQLDVYSAKRHESQPREASAGCIFKNPPGASAGRLIDELGLKGERVGDAEVSPVHANFIVNRGHATGAEVIELIRRVRARVKEARGIELEPEALLYGKEWKDVL